MSEHTVMIGGTEYGIEGGRVLLGGVEYELESGRVLVDGVEKEITFKKKFTVTITVDGMYPPSEFAEKAYITIDGTKYYTAATLEVQQGTVIHCYACIGTSGSYYKSYISINGETVASSNGSAVEYDYTLNGNISIELELVTTELELVATAAKVFITEE